MAALMVFTGLIVLYAYCVEPFMSWYGGHHAHRSLSMYRATGAYAPYYWMMVGFNGVLPLAFLWRSLRRNWAVLFIIGILINVGMWLERYVIIVTSQAHDYLPSAWHLYTPSWVEISISIGAGCFFLFALLVALRVIPAVALTETKAEMVEERHHGVAAEAAPTGVAGEPTEGEARL